MISLWIIFGLIISTVCVAGLAAAFSVVGIGALFSGALIAVIAMASSLEFSKFVLAAYLHQRWNEVHKVFRTYLVFAIVILSLITSMGIFGFLSDAYQSASSAIEKENIKLQTEKNKQNSITSEIARINKSIEEIPASRISKKLKARQEAEPMILDLNKKFNDTEKVISDLNLVILEIKKKVGPLIYISRAFNVDIDTVVKYLIFIFVLVFDPLAICLVIATTQAIDSRKKKSVKFETSDQIAEPQQQPIAQQPQTQPSVIEQEELIQMRYSEDAAPPSADTKETKVV